MKLEYLIESKIKDLEKEISELKERGDNSQGYILEQELQMADFTASNNTPGVRFSRTNSQIVQRTSGHYRVQIYIEKI